MTMALGLARRGNGATWPNPSVGCVIVNPDGHVLGRGHTGAGGRPHAETVALSQVGKASQGAVVYVTLEPCAHYGQTPPCADALVKANVARVVVATSDPDTRVSGKGVEILKKAGIQVDFGLCQTDANLINQGFFQSITDKRPLITMKIASSQDGMIASATDPSKWITGPESRQRGHLLRANHDAIMVGIGTVLADNPSLDCRLPGLRHRSPVRIVVDSALRLPLDCKLVETAKNIPTWVITAQENTVKRDTLEKLDVKVVFCELDSSGQINLSKMMTLLADEGITRLLSEGGAQLNASLIRASLVDRLYWFRSPTVIGGGGLPALPSRGGIEEVIAMPNYSLVRSGQTGNDVWQEFKIGH